MRHRFIALAAVVALAAPLATSCIRRPPPPPGGGGGGVPAGTGQNCGTITDGVVTQRAQNGGTPASCWLQYHVFTELYVTIVKDGVTTRIQAKSHNITVSRSDGATCSGFAQVTLSDNGTFFGACTPKGGGGGGGVTTRPRITLPTLPGRTTTTMGSMPGMDHGDHGDH
jgi:hypothetical protein